MVDESDGSAHIGSADELVLPIKDRGGLEVRLRRVDPSVLNELLTRIAESCKADMLIHGYVIGACSVATFVEKPRWKEPRAYVPIPDDSHCRPYGEMVRDYLDGDGFAGWRVTNLHSLPRLYQQRLGGVRAGDASVDKDNYELLDVEPDWFYFTLPNVDGVPSFFFVSPEALKFERQEAAGETSDRPDDRDPRVGYRAAVFAPGN